MKRYIELFVLLSVISMKAADDGYNVQERLQKVNIGSNLKEAIEKGDNAAAKHIIKKADEIPKGALHYSIAHNQDALAKFMLKRSASVNQKAKGLYPLMVAVASKSTLVSSLLKKGADVHHIDAKNGSTALFYACTVQGPEGKVYFDKLVRRGANTHARSLKGITALQLATAFGNDEIVTSILDKKMCDINAQDNEDWTALMYARAYNRKQIMLALIQAGAKIDAVNDKGDTVLHIEADIFAGCDSSFSGNGPDAAKCDDDIAIVKELLAACPHMAKMCNKKGETPLHIAVENDRADLIPVLTPYIDINAIDEDGATPLMCAIGDNLRSTKQEVVDALLVAGADLNAGHGWRGTPLQAACKKGNLELLRGFLALGADANKTDSCKSTALEGAIIRGQAECVKELIPHCNIEQQNSNETTPLWQAMYRTDNEHGQEIAVMLINAGANVHGVTRWGGSLLLPAVQNNWVEVVKLLLTKGLDPLAMDKDGETLFGYAHQEKCSPEMMKLLLQAAFNKGPRPLNDDNLKDYAKMFKELAKKAKLVMEYNKAQEAQQAKERS